MKSGSTKAALEAVLKLKVRKAAYIEQTMRQLEGIALEQLNRADVLAPTQSKGSRGRDRSKTYGALARLIRRRGHHRWRMA